MQVGLVGALSSRLSKPSSCMKFRVLVVGKIEISRA